MSLTLSIDLAGQVVALSLNFTEWIAYASSGEPIGLLLVWTGA